jgi:hypothetical protein
MSLQRIVFILASMSPFYCSPRQFDAGAFTLGDAGFAFPSLTSAESVTHRQSICPSLATNFVLSSDFQTGTVIPSLNVWGSFIHMRDYGMKAMTNHFDSTMRFLETMNRVDYHNSQLGSLSSTVSSAQSCSHCFTANLSYYIANDIASNLPNQQRRYFIHSLLL